MRWVSLLAVLAVGAIGADTAAGACPNEAIRAQQGSQQLPDCRAYELVTTDGRLTNNSEPARASISGDSITYYSVAPMPTAQSSSYFHLARRHPLLGWSNHSVGPQVEPGALQEGVCEQNVFFSADLRSHTYEQGWYDPTEPGLCKRSEEIVAGEPFPQRNVLLYDDSGAPRLVNVTAADVDPASLAPANAKRQDASDDFSRIVFSTEARLTSDAPAGYNFYAWEDGSVRLLTVLPDGEPAAGELVEAAGHRLSTSTTTVAGSGLAPVTGALSASGDRAFFYSGAGLYLRERPTEPQSAVSGGECTEPERACTIQIDASQGPGAGGGGVFWRASADGGTVFFTSDSRLTDDSTAEPGKPDLYRYDVESGALTDLTVSSESAADVRGVVAAAEDSSSVYFVANGNLAEGGSAGDCTGTVAAAQRCDLYALSGESITFVARLSRADRSAWQEGSTGVQRRKLTAVRANASTSGRYLAFISDQRLTGYDNRDINTATVRRQLFLFDADGLDGDGELSCVSCIPDGTRPSDSTIDILLGRNYGAGDVGGHPNWKVRSVLDDGSVFFDSRDALVDGDENGVRDVYQYKAGTHTLISTGEHGGESRFFDASPSGSDVFFRTGESLVRSDTDNENVSLYDARVGGGFPEGHDPDPHCEEEACRGIDVIAPAVLAPGSTVLVGEHAPRVRRPQRRCRIGGRVRTGQRCKQAAKRRARQARRCKKRGSARQVRRCKARMRQQQRVHRGRLVESGSRAR